MNEPLLPSLPPRPDEGPRWREYALLALTCAVTFVACYQPLWDPDTYWHLAVGREIWQSGHLMRTETFSFVAKDTPWEDTEWLFHLLVYPLWRVAGDVGLSIATALAGALVVGLAYRSVRLAGGNAAVHCLYFLLLMGTFQSRIRMRPDLVSLVFMALLVEGLLRWKPEAPRAGRFLAFLTALFWLWAQFHGGWAYGLALLGACLAGAALDGLRDRRLDPAYVKNLCLAGAAPVAALFVNPYGWKIPWFPIKSLLGFRDPTQISIAEWAPTPWEWTYIPFFCALAVLGVAMLAAWRKVTWKDALWFASQAFLGLYWVRYTAYAILALAPLAAERAAPLRRLSFLDRALWAAALLAAAVSGAFDFSAMPMTWDLSERYPVSEVAFLRTHYIPGNLLNTYNIGGYLDWFAYPLNRPFMDGRYYPFVDPLRDYYKAHETVKAYEEFLETYAFDLALFPYPDYLIREGGAPPTAPRRGPSALFFPGRTWALVHFGNYGMVFLRRQPRYEEVIRGFEFKALRPDDLGYLAAASRMDASRGEPLRLEIRRKLGEDPWTKLKPKLEKALRDIEAARETTPP